MADLLEKILQNPNFNDTDRALVQKAYNIAELAHRGQKRMSGEDYIVHPLLFFFSLFFFFFFFVWCGYGPPPPPRKNPKKTTKKNKKKKKKKKKKHGGNE